MAGLPEKIRGCLGNLLPNVDCLIRTQVRQQMLTQTRRRVPPQIRQQLLTPIRIQHFQFLARQQLLTLTLGD